MPPCTPPRGKTQGATASGERIAEGDGPAPSRGPAAPRRPAPPAPPAHRPPSRLHVQILDVRRRAPEPLPHLRTSPHTTLSWISRSLTNSIMQPPALFGPLFPSRPPYRPCLRKRRTRNPRVDRESLAQKDKNSCFSMLIASPSKPFESAERHSGCCGGHTSSACASRGGSSRRPRAAWGDEVRQRPGKGGGRLANAGPKAFCSFVPMIPCPHEDSVSLFSRPWAV